MGESSGFCPTSSSAETFHQQELPSGAWGCRPQPPKDKAGSGSEAQGLEGGVDPIRPLRPSTVLSAVWARPEEPAGPLCWKQR